MLRANALNGSTLGGELALRPGFSPQARMPPTAHLRHEARGVGYCFDRGASVLSTGVTPPTRWLRSDLVERAAAVALCLTRGLS